MRRKIKLTPCPLCGNEMNARFVWCIDCDHFEDRADLDLDNLAAVVRFVASAVRSYDKKKAAQ